MKFAPQPQNDFAEFIRRYYDECRSRFDGIEAIAGKWMFRDLIPGLSDFDTRFICRNHMAADDWCQMSAAVGEAHLSFCRRYACWSRNLEHLPGINLTWQELASEATYYPEYQQWTFYHTEQPEKLRSALDVLTARPWDAKDEYFHLKKFCLYYGRYDREIDPGCNLYPHANKYPLHSRLMHYFVPPVQSAMCILEKRHIAGKFDALELAQRRFRSIKCWDTVGEILSARYEVPKWYQEPRLSHLEDSLEAALSELASALRDATTLVPASAGLHVVQWKEALRNVPIEPAMIIFDNAKFARLFKGRLLFYANAPWHFDSTWCIENELRRIGNNFFKAPFGLYWKLTTGEDVSDPTVILPKLSGSVITEAEADATSEFARLTLIEWEQGRERELALAIAESFDDFFKALYKISQSIGGK